MEVIVLQVDTIDILAERTDRSKEQLMEELFVAIERGTRVHYYFGLPDMSQDNPAL